MDKPSACNTPNDEQVGWLCHHADGGRHFIWKAGDDVAEMEWIKKRYVRWEPLFVRSETAPLADALAGLLAHCDYTSDCETDYEKAVHAGRAALNAYIKSVTK